MVNPTPNIEVSYLVGGFKPLKNILQYIYVKKKNILKLPNLETWSPKDFRILEGSSLAQHAVLFSINGDNIG